MKKITSFILAVAVCVTALTGCNSKPDDPGTPPSEVISPNSSQGNSANNSAGNNTINSTENSTGGDTQNTNSDTQSTGNATAHGGEVLENAVSVRIGNGGRKDWYINMYDNAAAQTMLGYLTRSELRFPTYNYDEENGYVSQSVRGSYTRDDEITVADVKTGELYLFSGGQLRFYFKDCEGVNITATPIGYYVETEGLEDAVIDAYTTNLGDTWGVDVYFNITKRI